MSEQARQFFWMYIILVITVHIVPISDNVAPDDYYYISMRPDQIIHFFMFSPFCFLIWAWQQVNFYEDVFFCLAVLFIGVIFSFVLEFLHLFIPYRSFELGDLVANVLGALAGSIAFLIRSE